MFDRMPQTTREVPRVRTDQADGGAGPVHSPSTAEQPAAASDEPATTAPVTLRPPTLEDGGHMWRLARDSGALDLNTSYA